MYWIQVLLRLEGMEHEEEEDCASESGQFDQLEGREREAQVGGKPHF